MSRFVHNSEVQTIETGEPAPCPYCKCDKIAVYYDAPESVGGDLAGWYISHPLWKTYPETWGCTAPCFPGKFDERSAAVTAWNTHVKTVGAPQTASSQDIQMPDPVGNPPGGRGHR